MRFVKEILIRPSAERVFAFHELADALDRLIPPWEKVRIIARAEIKNIGSHAIIETRIFGIIPVRWVSEHTLYDPPRSFVDEQVSGPFAFWRHRHIIEGAADGALLRDEIEYEAPLGPVGRILSPIIVRPRLEKLFRFRHQVTRAWCEGDKV